MQHITVVPYDPAWPGLYEAEAQAIAGVLGQRLTAIHHIGSTAVPGLAAKPVIDIMPVVRAVTEADECRAHPARAAAYGAPFSSRSASASHSANSRKSPVPSALPKASFAAKLAAAVCGRMPRFSSKARSAGPYTFSRKPGRLMLRATRASLTMSTPMPMIIRRSPSFPFHTAL